MRAIAMMMILTIPPFSMLTTTITITMPTTMIKNNKKMMESSMVPKSSADPAVSLPSMDDRISLLVAAAAAKAPKAAEESHRLKPTREHDGHGTMRRRSLERLLHSGPLRLHCFTNAVQYAIL